MENWSACVGTVFRYPTANGYRFSFLVFSFNLLDLAKLLAHIPAMIKANIGQLKDNLSKFLSYVEKGETITICKRNIPIATLAPHGSRKTGNRTKLGCGMGTVQVEGDLTEPLIPEDAWDMHRQ